MKNTKLSKIIAPYVGTNLWIVLNKERTEILAKDKSLVKALGQIKGREDSPQVIKATPNVYPFIG